MDLGVASRSQVAEILRQAEKTLHPMAKSAEIPALKLRGHGASPESSSTPGWTRSRAEGIIPYCPRQRGTGRHCKGPLEGETAKES